MLPSCSFPVLRQPTLSQSTLFSVCGVIGPIRLLLSIFIINALPMSPDLRPCSTGLVAAMTLLPGSLLIVFILVLIPPFCYLTSFSAFPCTPARTCPIPPVSFSPALLSPVSTARILVFFSLLDLGALVFSAALFPPATFSIVMFFLLYVFFLLGFFLKLTLYARSQGQ